MKWLTVTFVIISAVQIVHVTCTNNTTDEDVHHEMLCVNGSSSDFPDDLFNESQKKNGALILHFILALYCFVIIALVCNDYFIPSVECICVDLNMSQDVAGATFMAIATSTPELFINIIGTFVTESDLGVGTVVGCAVFNALGIATCLGLAASKLLELEWWAITRDCSIYAITIAVMTSVTYDGRVEWYEALVLFLMYITYFIIMFSNRYLMNLANKAVIKAVGSKADLQNDVENGASEVSKGLGPGIYRWYLHGDFTAASKMNSSEMEKNPDKENKSCLGCPPTGGFMQQTWQIFSWPISMILLVSIPDCRKDNMRQFYPITFIMCVVWIGAASYLCAWMMSVIGDTVGVPDSVMGLTFLAAGGSLPEAFTSIIMARKGIGAYGISNSVGGNTLDILLCLGFPWLIKCIVLIAQTGSFKSGYVQIVSEGVTYNCAALMLSLALMYIVLAIFRFRVGRRVGFICLILYIIFISFSVLLEMNYFFQVVQANKSLLKARDARSCASGGNC